MDFLTFISNEVSTATENMKLFLKPFIETNGANWHEVMEYVQGELHTSSEWEHMLLLTAVSNTIGFGPDPLNIQNTYPRFSIKETQIGFFVVEGDEFNKDSSDVNEVPHHCGTSKLTAFNRHVRAIEVALKQWEAATTPVKPTEQAHPVELPVVRIVRFPYWELTCINPRNSSDGFKMATKAYGLTLSTDSWLDSINIEGGEISPESVDEIHVGSDIYYWHRVYGCWTTDTEYFED